MQKTEPYCPQRGHRYLQDAPSALISSLQSLHDLGHAVCVLWCFTPDAMSSQDRRKLEFALFAVGDSITC